MTLLETLQKEAQFDSEALENLINGCRRGELDSVCIHDFVRATVRTTLEQVEREIDTLRNKTRIEPCDNCGEEGWGKAWYGHGEATGDAYGDRYHPTGEMVFCIECSPSFTLGKQWQGQEIWKRTSDREEYSQTRINAITRKLTATEILAEALSIITAFDALFRGWSGKTTR